ncbi:hypothetical protein C0Q70_04300 [Pomacea canaliculata]|uniref:Uncharacterized protein n=1 Tax=Pomacea canaliculata TaxID=400727 RepID=A0A2T7PV57_POMCA|nr:hypothetical protein C0Q70_04300 [Pomacea canaliculata]
MIGTTPTTTPPTSGGSTIKQKPFSQNTARRLPRSSLKVAAEDDDVDKKTGPWQAWPPVRLSARAPSSSLHQSSRTLSRIASETLAHPYLETPSLQMRTSAHRGRPKCDSERKRALDGAKMTRRGGWTQRGAGVQCEDQLLGVRARRGGAGWRKGEG